MEALAREGDAQRFKFSRPLIRKPNCNFSYAGLKTAVRLAIEAEVPGPPSEANKQVRPLPFFFADTQRRHFELQPVLRQLVRS